MTTNTKRRILLAVSGMSPQIVTETLYALVTRPGNPWLPDEIHLLSTQEGCERAKAELLHESRDMFGKFCRDYVPEGHVIKFDEQCLHAFTRGGEPLSDIRDLEDSALVADAIAAKVWELTSDPATEIHASLAGGRKSMGFLLGYAMSLYGRPQDRLSHVLVSDGFEGSTNFYYPPKKPVIIHDRNGKPWDTADAVVSLAEIPILHLRHLVPKKIIGSPASFTELIEMMNLSLSAPSIEINDAKGTVKCHGIDIGLTKTNFAVYRFLAKKARDAIASNVPDDKMVDLKNLDADECMEMMSHAKWDQFKEESEKTKYAKIFSDFDSRKKFFDERRNDIKNSLREKLAHFGTQYEIDTLNNHGSFISVENIVFLEETLSGVSTNVRRVTF
ncbi:MAG: TIGR02584 family CRISPR-associated protein [Oxalobacteraceae bacterium]|nr:TIGR02584 family CRISPR-associated protein [Oxalobacteraceae bacterium]